MIAFPFTFHVLLVSFYSLIQQAIGVQHKCEDGCGKNWEAGLSGNMESQE
jgi:hypothetical protein